MKRAGHRAGCPARNSSVTPSGCAESERKGKTSRKKITVRRAIELAREIMQSTDEATARRRAEEAKLLECSDCADAVQPWRELVERAQHLFDEHVTEYAGCSISRPCREVHGADGWLADAKALLGEKP